MVGAPYDNSQKTYSGSFNDSKLNAGVARFSADPTALAMLNAGFATSGILVRPLVTLDTTRDPIVPYWHEDQYSAKVTAAGSEAMHTNIPISRYGHCQFTPAEALAGFVILVEKSTGATVPNAEQVLPDDDSRAEYRSLLQQYGPGAP